MTPAPDDKDRLILEARKVLDAVAPRVIWKRTIKAYQAKFGPETVRVEVTKDLRIRVVNPRTGEAVEAPAEGPRTP